MEYFLFKLSCFIMTVHASSLKIFPLPAESYSGGGLEKTLELWISQEKCCHFRSSNLWKECRNVKVHLQGITLYFAKRSVFTLKKLEYFCWQEIAQLRTTVFISASRNTINKAIIVSYVYLFTGLYTVYVYPQAIQKFLFFKLWSICPRYHDQNNETVHVIG